MSDGGTMYLGCICMKCPSRWNLRLLQSYIFFLFSEIYF